MRAIFKSNLKLKKGFTLIELLVVISIISLLASVVLASLNNARAKGFDAKIKEQLSQMRSQAEIYYNSQTPPTYVGVFTDPVMLSLFNSAQAVSDYSGYYQPCGDVEPYWVAQVWLKSEPEYAWRVDGLGGSGKRYSPNHAAFNECGGGIVPDP